MTSKIIVVGCLQLHSAMMLCRTFICAFPLFSEQEKKVSVMLLIGCGVPTVPIPLFLHLGFCLFLLQRCSILKVLDGCDQAKGLMRPT